VKADKVEKDLQEYRQRKLQYLTKREGDQVKGERKNFEGEKWQPGVGTKDQIRGEDAGGLRKEERNLQEGTNFEGGRSLGVGTKDVRSDERNYEGSRSQGGTKDFRADERNYEGRKNFEGEGSRSQGGTKDVRVYDKIYDERKNFGEGSRSQVGAKDVRADERNYDGGRMKGAGDRIGGNFMGSEFSLGNEKKDHGDYQFHKMKQNEGFQKEGYTHPPFQQAEGYQRDYGYYNNPPSNWTAKGYNNYQPTDNLVSGQRGVNMGPGV
jgi:hypothetical protein